MTTLLCQPNQAVSADGLIEAIWEAAAPKTAAKNLHVYIYQLQVRLGEQWTPPQVVRPIAQRTDARTRYRAWRRIATCGDAGEEQRDADRRNATHGDAG